MSMEARALSTVDVSWLFCSLSIILENFIHCYGMIGHDRFSMIPLEHDVNYICISPQSVKVEIGNIGVRVLYIRIDVMNKKKIDRDTDVSGSISDLTEI